MDLSNSHALVLGASRAIGREIARELALAGARLILPWFDWPEASAEMKEEFGGKTAGHLLPRVDLRNAGEVQALADLIAANFGSLHVLVNNIERGGMPIVHGSYERPVNEGQWQREMDTTLHAKWLVFNKCLPLLRRAANAAVLNFSSIAGVAGRLGPAGLLFNDGYAAANRGVAMLTETWARLGAPTIRVNEIMLGLIDHRHGPGTRGWQLLTEKDKQRLLAHTLLGRTGTPTEVARLAMHIIREADFMTGTVIRFDGGYLLGAEEVTPVPPGVL